MRDCTGNAAWELCPRLIVKCTVSSLQSWDETTYKHISTMAMKWRQLYVPIILDYYSGQFL